MAGVVGGTKRRQPPTTADQGDGEAMSNSDIFVSVAYALYVIAPGIREELWLRTALFFNSIGFAIWGLWIGSWPVVVANVLFCLVSLRQMRRAYEERRPVELPPEATLIGTELFPEMAPHDLQRFYDLGQDLSISNDALLTLGDEPTHLYAVLEGNLWIHLPDGSIIARPTPAIVGEVGALLEGRVSATVVANEARVHKWRRSDLDKLQRSHPSFTGPFLKGLSAQLVTWAAA